MASDLATVSLQIDGEASAESEDAQPGNDVRRLGETTAPFSEKASPVTEPSSNSKLARPAKKIKCDGLKPRCNNCFEAGVGCTIPEVDGRKNKKRRIVFVDLTNPQRQVLTSGPLSIQHDAGMEQLLQYDVPCDAAYQPEVSSVGDDTIVDFSAFADASLDSLNANIGAQPATAAQPDTSFQLLTEALGLQVGSSNTAHPETQGLEMGSGFDAGTNSLSNVATSSVPVTQAAVPNFMQPLTWQFTTGSVNVNGAATTQARSAAGGDAQSGRQDMGDSQTSSTPKDGSLRLQYLRPFGPTAIQPGIEQISIAIRAPPSQSRATTPDLTSQAAVSEPISISPAFTFENFPLFSGITPPTMESGVNKPKLFEQGSDTPRHEILEELLPLFFNKMGSLFPFLTLADVQSTEDAPDIASRLVCRPLLLNTICSLAARFSQSPSIVPQDPKRSPATYGIPFANQAKKLLVPLLGYPSSRTVASMLLMAYHEFGLNSEGALWMYSGMALRMAVDLGLHLNMTEPETSVHPQARIFDKLVWWSCFLLDRTLAIGTGRPVTVKDAEILVALPSDDDLASMCSVQYPSSFNEESNGSLFAWAYCIRMFHLYGMIAETVNIPSAIRRICSESASRTDNYNTSMPTRSTSPDPAITMVEDSITNSYNELPQALCFSPDNFREHCAVGRGLPFLHLHLWYHAIIILLHRVPLLHPHLSAAGLSLADRLTVVNSSCLAISHMLTSADADTDALSSIFDGLTLHQLVDPFTYMASPFTNQAFFLAARAWTQDYRIRTGRDVLSGGRTGSDSKSHPRSSSNILAHVAQSNFRTCANALSRQSKYWSGVGWIAAVVDKLGGQRSRISLKAATEGVATFVSPQELAILKRLLPQTSASSAPLREISQAALTTMFSAVAPGMHTTLAAQTDFTQDDMAFAYSLAGSLPDHYFSMQSYA